MSTIKLELRTLAKGDATVRMIYQIRGVRGYYSTKQKVYPDNWDSEEQRAKYKKGGTMTAAEVKEVNESLNDLEKKVERIEKKFEALGELFTPEKVIAELTVDKKQAPSNELFAFIDTYIERNSNTRAKGSLTVYKVLKGHLIEFGERVTFSTIDYNFFQAFQNHLLKEKTKRTKKGKLVKYRLNNISVAKQLSTLKTLLNYASKSGIEVNQKYKTFSFKRDTDLEVIALTQKEFDALCSLQLKPEWDKVRDIFCLSCLTGLRYSDLKQLKPVHVKENFIDLTSVKTTLRVKIPLVPQSRAILKKWNNQMAIISNQRMNEHLKKIFEWNNIATDEQEIVRSYGAKTKSFVQPRYELISMHCGRKTFATLSLQRGMSAEQVMKIGGWKSYSSFKRYVDVTDEHAQQAMIAAYTNPSSKMKAAS